MAQLPYLPFFCITSYSPSGVTITAETSSAAYALEEARRMYNQWNDRAYSESGYVRVVAFRYFPGVNADDKANGIMICEVGNDAYSPEGLY